MIGKINWVGYTWYEVVNVYQFLISALKPLRMINTKDQQANHCMIGSTWIIEEYNKSNLMLGSHNNQESFIFNSMISDLLVPQ